MLTSDYLQDGNSVCCCYDYCFDTQLQNCVVRCVLRVIGCAVVGACHTGQEYPQDGGHGKMADSLYYETCLCGYDFWKVA